MGPATVPETKPVTGVIANMTESYNSSEIAASIDHEFDIEVHDELPSTNERASELAAAGKTDVVVVCNRQTAGRGRKGREWRSPPGGVWTSLLVSPDISTERIPIVTLGMGATIATTLNDFGVSAGIKWPNDVVTDETERKLAGVLTELSDPTEAGQRPQVIVGVGINVAIAEEQLPTGATSMRLQGSDATRQAVLIRILNRFDRLGDDVDRMLDAWRSQAMTIGRSVRVETPTETLTGEAIALTETGALVIRTDQGRQTVTAGDCIHLRSLE